MKINRKTEVTNNFAVELDEMQIEELLAEAVRQKIVEQHGLEFANLIVAAEVLPRLYQSNCHRREG